MHIRSAVTFPSLITLLALACSAQVQAGGINLYGASIDNAALSNAGVAARAQGPDTISGNIAGLTYVKGTQINGGVSVLFGEIKPDVQETTNSGGNGSNALNPVLAPMGYISHQLDDQWTIGFGSYGDFGDELDYDNDWAGRYFIQNDKLVGASLVPSVAYRFNDQWSFGLGLRAMYGMIDLQLAQRNNGALCKNGGGCEDGKVKYTNEDWGFGGNAGIIYAPQEGTRIGLAYTSELDLDFDANLKVSGVGGGNGTNFPGFDPSTTGPCQVPPRLRPDYCSGPARPAKSYPGNFDEKVSATITVPQTLTLSLFQQLDSQWAFLASANWQDQSEMSTVPIQIPDLGVDTEANLHWKDTYHGSLGLQYQATPQWLWNAGIGYDTSAVDDKDRIWGLPVTDTIRGSVGAVVALDEATSVHVAYMLTWLGDVDIPDESRDQPDVIGGPQNATGKINDAYVQYLGAGVTMRF